MIKDRINAGVWIDHRRAVIVILKGRRSEMLQIESNIGKRVRFSAASYGQSTTGLPDNWAEDTRDRRYTAYLGEYYNRVAHCLDDVDSLLITGPGEARSELVEYLMKHHLKPRIDGVEPADKLTDAQIEAKVRHHFKRRPAKS